MTRLPPIDLHAHVDANIESHEMDALHAVIFAVTRSLDEAAIAVARSDTTAVWGVGCHPALARSHDEFDPIRFAELLASVCFAGELGLDGNARVALDRQRGTLRAAFRVLAELPRITSLHSAGATTDLLDELERTPISGAVLHWWLGTPAETVRALDLGCYFSLNHSGVRRNKLLSLVPLDRLLTETDHPFGDRRSKAQRPGNVVAVEEVLAKHHQLTPDDVRRQMWHNLAQLVRQTGSAKLVPRALRTFLASVA
jgi:TatD DNase family protein